MTIAFLVAGAALERGRDVAIWCTKEAVRLALPGHADAVACDGCPPLARLFEQFADGGGKLLICPICASRKLDESGYVANAEVAGATPMLEWLGDEGGAIFTAIRGPATDKEVPCNVSRSRRRMEERR